MVRLLARDYTSKDSKWAQRVKRRTVKISDAKLDSEIRGMLTMYCADVTEAIDKAGDEMVKELVKITRNTAPARTGRYYQNITSQTVKRPSGNLYIWGVKGPYYRLTHLLVKGHPTGNGGRTKGDPFLANALEEVLPEYEYKVLEALKNVK